MWLDQPMSETTTPAPLTDGCRVTGSYMGEDFTGTLISHRGHTINWRVCYFSVDFDQPTVICDRERDGIIVDASFDGSVLPASSGWDSYGSFIKAAVSA